MTRNIISIFLFCLTLTACEQTKDSNTITGLTIDPSIKKEVEKHIEASKELDAFKDKMQVYINSGDIQSYENDSLILNSQLGKDKTPFKAFDLGNAETLTLDGAFGLFGGLGFVIVIVPPHDLLCHILHSTDSPTYSYNYIYVLVCIS